MWTYFFKGLLTFRPDEIAWIHLLGHAGAGLYGDLDAMGEEQGEEASGQILAMVVF